MNYEDEIAKLEKTIVKQGKRIARLKDNKKLSSLPDNEYIRLINRLQMSENELLISQEENLTEIEELKKEITELLLCF